MLIKQSIFISHLISVNYIVGRVSKEAEGMSDCLLFSFLKILFMRDRERQRHRQREKQASCRKPDARLDLGSPGSCPGRKAGTKPLSHPGMPQDAY